MSLSPDGNYVYVASTGDNAVSVFRRDRAMGNLTFVQMVKDGVGGVDGLSYAMAAVTSPDGKHLYATGSAEDAVAVFQRDASGSIPVSHVIDVAPGQIVSDADFGDYDLPPQVVSIARADADPSNDASIRFVVTFTESVSGIDPGDFLVQAVGVTGAAVIAIDGGGASYTITVDTGSGDGTLRLDLADDDSIVDSVGNPLGGFGAGNGGFSSGPSYSIDKTPPVVGSVLRDDLNPTTAESVRFYVMFSEAVTGVDGTLFSLTGPGLTGASVTDVAGSGANYVVTVGTGAGTGSLRLDVIDSGVDVSDFSPVAAGLTGVAVVSVHGSGNAYLVLVSTGTGAGTLRLDLVDDDSIVDAVGLPLGGVGSGNGSFTGGEVFTVGSATGVVRGAVWDDLDGDRFRDAGEPRLPYVTVFLDTNGNGQPDTGEPTRETPADDPGTPGVDEAGEYEFIGLAPGSYTVAQVIPAGYAQTYPAVTVPGTGSLSFLEVLKDNQGGANGLQSAGKIAASSDGRFLYVNSPAEDSIAVFERDRSTGRLTFVHMLSGSSLGLDMAAFAAMSPDENHVYVGGYYSTLAIFERDPATGRLTHLQTVTDGANGVDGLGGARHMDFTSDGRFAYVVGESDHSLVVFRRDTTTGGLTFLQLFKDGVGGVDGLYTASCVALSPDDQFVYVTSYYDDSLSVYRRDLVTGLLTLVEMQKNGQGGVDGLNAAMYVAVSRDGRYVYTAASADGLTVFGRDAATGRLTFLEVHKDGQNGVDGLAEATSLAISPDGEDVYVTANLDHSLALFDRDQQTGLLTYVQLWRDGQDGVDGLNTANSVLVSPDNAQVYATGRLDNALTAFVRDATRTNSVSHALEMPGDRTLEHLHFGNHDVPPVVTSITRASANPTAAESVDFSVTFSEPVMAIDAGDFALAVSGVTDASVAAVAGSDAAYTVTVNTGTGSGTLQLRLIDDDTIKDVIDQPLGGPGGGNGNHVRGESYTIDKTPPAVTSIVRAVPSPTHATTLAFTVTFSEVVSQVDASDFQVVADGPAGASITGVTGSGTTYTVSVDAGTGDGTLRLDLIDDDTIIDHVANPLGGPGVGNGDFTTGTPYAIDRTPPTVLSIVRLSASPTDAASVAFTVTFSESVTGVNIADFVLTKTGLPGAAVTGLTGSGATRTVTVGTGLGDGTLRLDLVDDDSIGDSAANALGGSGSGNGDYALGETYTIDRTGVIRGSKWDDQDRDGYRDYGEPGLAGVTVFLDLNNNGSLDAGEPTALTQDDDPGTPDVDERGCWAFADLGPRSYVVREVTPEGWEQTFPVTRTGATGRLTFVEMLKDNVGGIDGLDEAAGVAVSPDGNHIYVASYTDNALAVFRRDPANGRATLLQVLKDGVGGIDGLWGAQSVTVSPDGKHVYVASYFDNSVAVFQRDLLAGTVTYVERQKDGVNGVDGLLRALSVAVSPDGAHVYAVGQDDDAVVCFARNPNTGQLTFVQMVKDGVGGVDGLNGAFSVAVSPDGAHVYVAGTVDLAVSAFARNPATGVLTFVEMKKDGVGGVDGLYYAPGLTLSPDGKHLYVAGKWDHAIAVFSRNATTGALTWVEKRTHTSLVLNRVIAVSVSPDGGQVYSANDERDMLGVFSRNASTGRLTFVEEFTDGVGGIDGLDEVWYTTVSPDGKNLYAVGATDDALVTFSRNAGTAQPAPYTVTLTSGQIVEGLRFANYNLPPSVTAITLQNASPTRLATVNYTVTFSESVAGINESDFIVTTTGGVSAASVVAVAGGGASYTVTVDTGSGDGTVRLDLADDDSITDLTGLPLGDVGPGNGSFNGGQVCAIDKTPPVVNSIVRSNPSPTSAASVDFTVTFSEAVTQVDPSDFVVDAGGPVGASVAGVSGSGTTYTVTASTGTGDGTIRLDVLDNDSVLDAAANPLGGDGLGNGDFAAGEAYTIDRSPPVVVSIVRSGASPTDAALIDFTVTFSEAVTGVDRTDFVLNAAGLAGTYVNSVSGSGATYAVSAGTGHGSGTLRLDLVDDDSIVDVTMNALGGSGAGNGDFASGEAFAVEKAEIQIAGPAWIHEGATYTLSLSESVPNTITSWTIDWGDGNVDTLPGNPVSAAHVFSGRADAYSIRATAIDSAGATYSTVYPAGIDPSFGAVGYASTSIRENTSDALPDMLLQPGGKIVAAGNTNSGVAALTRYDSNGALDATFGSGGKVTHSGTAWFYDVAVAPDGKIYAAGVTTGNGDQFLLARYNANGTIDTTFGSSGIVLTDFSTTTSDGARAVILQADGKIVLAGYSGNNFAFSRYGTSGSLDTSFASTGKKTVSLGGNYAKAESVAIDSTGRIVAAGYVQNASSQYDWGVVRLTANGATDTSFSGDGIDVLNLVANNSNQAYDLAIQADGKIVVGGMGGYNLAVVRYNANGTLDATFDSDGKLISPPWPSIFERIWAVGLGADGRLVALGGYVDDYQLVRYDTAAGTMVSVPGFAVSATGLLVPESGVSGTFTVALDSKPAADVVIALSSTDTSEGVVVPESLTFTPANWNVPQVVTVRGVHDFVDDGDVSYTVVTAPAVSTDPAYGGFDPPDVPATTVDDDTASIVITQSDNSTAVTEGGLSDSYAVRLGSQPTADVTIAVAPDSQLTAVSATLTFTAANWNIDQTVNVSAVDDAAQEGPHTGSISHTASSADPLYHGMTNALTVTITDNEPAEIRGAVWDDQDGDGQRDPGEPGLDGRSLYLDLDRDGQFDTDKPTAVTSGGGQYVFPGLPSGAYSVGQRDYPGWHQIEPATDLTAIERVSVKADGTQGDQGSTSPAMSADGRYVTFASSAITLVPNAGGQFQDILLNDRQTDALEWISRTYTGDRANGSSSAPSISADGRYVAFDSYASNLVPNDTNQASDVFVYDRQTQTMERVSLAAGGLQTSGYCYRAAISDNGRFVAFSSGAPDLVPGDTNGWTDVFVFDRQSRSIERVSVSSAGAQANGNSAFASISGNGRYVAFSSSASLPTEAFQGLTDRVPTRRTSSIASPTSSNG